MKQIKFKYLKTYNALIVFLISALGFASSCDIYGGKMYGTPSADFIIKGKIESSSTNNPVAGIKVKMSHQLMTDKGNITVGMDSTFSDAPNGTYQVRANDQFPDSQTFKLSITDVDGAQNGEFEALDTTIVFQNPKFSNGSGSWNQGQTEMQVDVKLKPKK